VSELTLLFLLLGFFAELKAIEYSGRNEVLYGACTVIAPISFIIGAVLLLVT
jgi:hypothetical protein